MPSGWAFYFSEIHKNKSNSSDPCLFCCVNSEPHSDYFMKCKKTNIFMINFVNHNWYRVSHYYYTVHGSGLVRSIEVLVPVGGEGVGDLVNESLEP